jgi:hypothetical protein
MQRLSFAVIVPLLIVNVKRYDRLMHHDAAWQERIACVLSGALRVWGVCGTVECDPDHTGQFLVSTAAGTQLRIVHRGGWLVFLSNIELLLGEHAGLPGLLRRLREELAPGAAAGRLVIGAQPLLIRDEHGT